MKKNRLTDFKTHMSELLGESEAGLLLDAIRVQSRKSLRYNRLHCSPPDLSGPVVPWCDPYGRFYEGDIAPASTLSYALGHYYIQEAAAMLAVSMASRVIDFNGKTVIDLTAAPGGKTTQAAELLGTGYMVANEVVRKRIDPLIWNVNRHRLHNVAVTSMSTEFLAQTLPGFFDIVIVDAPCSGEGLFQVKRHSPAKWSRKNVRFCARRQETILQHAEELLKPGGFLVYSTCTFSKEENEDQVGNLLNRGFAPVAIPNDIPVSPPITDHAGIQTCAARIFPHREGGAGAFAAVMRKETGNAGPEPAFASCKYDVRNDSFVSCPFLGEGLIRKDLLKDPTGFLFEKSGVISYFSSPRLPEIIMNRSFQIGAPLCDRRRDNDVMYGSVQLIDPAAAVPLTEEDARAYVGGEKPTIDCPDGVRYVSFAGTVLGPVKRKGDVCENRFPGPLRNRYHKPVGAKR